MNRPVQVLCDIWRSPPNGAEMTTTGEVEALLDEVWAQNFVYVALAPP